MRITFVCPSGNTPIGGVIALYEFANGLARRGHEVHLVHMPMWGRRIESLDDLGRYRFEPEIVHYLPGDDPASIPDTDLVFGTGSPERFGLPVLLVQGFEMLHSHLERMGFRTPSLKVCIAGWLADVGEVFGVPREQFHVVPMGIDRDVYRPITPLDHRPSQVAMLYSSHPAKGWAVGLAAVRAAHERMPALRVVVFGTAVPPGPLPDWITFHLDPDPQHLVTEIYNQSQVFLQASDYEGFGFTAVEAMACGCALVTTDNGGSRDYGHPGVTALVADPGDAATLADHLVTLLSDLPMRTRMAEAGRREVARFDWDLGAELLEAALLRYLADPARYLHEPGPDRTLGLELSQGELAARVLSETRPLTTGAGDLATSRSQGTDRITPSGGG